MLVVLVVVQHIQHSFNLITPSLLSSEVQSSGSVVVERCHGRGGGSRHSIRGRFIVS